MPNGLSNSQWSLSEQAALMRSSMLPSSGLGNLQARSALEAQLSEKLNAQFSEATWNGMQSPGSVDWRRIISNSDTQTVSFRGRVTGPVSALLAIFARWELSDKDGAVLLGKESAQYVADLRAGLAGLAERDTKDRARLLIQIYEGVHSLLRVKEQEASWLRASTQNLNGRSLLDLMRDGSVADLLLAKAYIDHANRR